MACADSGRLPADISRVVFWTEMLSPHLLPYARVLASKVGVDVQVVAYQEMTSDRLRLGWTAPNLGRAEIIIRPDLKSIRSLISTSPSASVHILHGIRGWPLGRIVARELHRGKVRFGVISESGMMYDVLQPIRNVVHWLDRVRWGRTAGFVLGAGRRGVTWFEARGYPPKSLFEFGYVTDPETIPIPQVPVPGTFQLLYVGRIVKRKGFGLLFRALAKCEDLDWKLTLIGSGPFESEVKRLAAGLGVASRISMFAAMPRASVINHMAAADLLVLPAHPYEGWGAVANEALQMGLPVICSSRCGCADLFGQSLVGEVFPSGSIISLTATLRRWIVRGRLDSDSRLRIRRWAERIGPESMTDYLVSILRNVYDGADRPLPPWVRP